jgi:hypothetical protein
MKHMLNGVAEEPEHRRRTRTCAGCMRFVGTVQQQLCAVTGLPDVHLPPGLAGEDLVLSDVKLCAKGCVK